MISLFPDYKLPTLFSSAHSAPPAPPAPCCVVFWPIISVATLHLNTSPLFTFKKPGTRPATNHKTVVQPQHAHTHNTHTQTHTHTLALWCSLHYFITLICVFFSFFMVHAWGGVGGGAGVRVGCGTADKTALPKLFHGFSPE